MPKDPMVGWYKGVDGRVRQSCAEVCEAAGKQCDNTPTKDVDSEAKFKATNAAIAKNHGAGFACKLYQGNSHGHMPGMYWNQKWCQYRNDGKVSAGCSAAHPNNSACAAVLGPERPRPPSVPLRHPRRNVTTSLQTDAVVVAIRRGSGSVAMRPMPTRFSLSTSGTTGCSTMAAKSLAANLGRQS